MSRAGALRVYFACIAAAGIVAACAKDTKPALTSTPEGATYSDGRVAFAVPPVPPGWRAVDVTHAVLGFRDDASRASILVNARCGAIDLDTPLLALTNHLLIGTTEREIVVQEVEPFDLREALHTDLVAKLDGVLLSFDIFVLKKDGCVYDLVRVAPARTEADTGAQAFETFARGFHTRAPR